MRASGAQRARRGGAGSGPAGSMQRCMTHFARYCCMLRCGDAHDNEIEHAVMLMLTDDRFWHEWCIDGSWHT
eukprot:6823165-Prymnesium_polylepis.1